MHVGVGVRRPCARCVYACVRVFIQVCMCINLYIQVYCMYDIYAVYNVGKCHGAVHDSVSV